MVLALSKASAMAFACVAMITDHEHWALRDEEGDKLGGVIDDVLSTLPERVYDKILAIADKWTPWAQLIFTLGILVWARVEESAKRVEAANYQPRDGGPVGDNGAGAGAAKASYRPYHSSLGYDN
jgi:hypothetical protein